LKVEYQGTTENSPIGHRTITSESTNVEVHNAYVYHGKYRHIHCLWQTQKNSNII
jgi:hypothetical protein